MQGATNHFLGRRKKLPRPKAAVCPRSLCSPLKHLLLASTSAGPSTSPPTLFPVHPSKYFSKNRVQICGDQLSKRISPPIFTPFCSYACCWTPGGRVKKLSPMIMIFQFELAGTGTGLRPRGHIFYVSPRMSRLIRTTCHR